MDLGQVLYIVRTERMMICMIILSIPLYVLLRVGQNRAPLPTEMFTNVELVLFRLIADAHIVNEAQSIHRFGECTHCCPSFYDQSRKRGVITLNHDFFSFHLLQTYTGPYV